MLKLRLFMRAGVLDPEAWVITRGTAHSLLVVYPRCSEGVNGREVRAEGVGFLQVTGEVTERQDEC